MKKVLSFALVAMLAMTTSAFAQTKIAVVDLEVAMAGSVAGKKATAEITAEFEKAQAKAQKIASEIEAISKEVEAQRSVLSQDAIQKKMADAQRKSTELERLEKDTQEDLQRRQMLAVNSIIPGMREVIKEYSEKNKIDLVIEAKEAGTLYANPSLDITNDIIKLYDTKQK